MNKSKIENLEKAILKDETENIECINVVIYGRDKQPKEIMKMRLIDENRKKIKNPKMLRVKQ